MFPFLKKLFSEKVEPFISKQNIGKESIILFFEKLFLDMIESLIPKKNNITFTSNDEDDFDLEEYEKFNAMIEREYELNEKGMEYESIGDIDNAIICYEENIKNEFAGSHPYRRLAIIYRRKKDYVNEIRVLEKALESYDDKGYKGKKYEEFQVRLIKAKLLRDKSR